MVISSITNTPLLHMARGQNLPALAQGPLERVGFDVSRQEYENVHAGKKPRLASRQIAFSLGSKQYGPALDVAFFDVVRSETHFWQ